MKITKTTNMLNKLHRFLSEYNHFLEHKELNHGPCLLLKKAEATHEKTLSMIY